jgi:hypothetical protein
MIFWYVWLALKPWSTRAWRALADRSLARATPYQACTLPDLAPASHWCCSLAWNSTYFYDVTSETAGFEDHLSCLLFSNLIVKCKMGSGIMRMYGHSVLRIAHPNLIIGIVIITCRLMHTSMTLLRPPWPLMHHSEAASIESTIVGEAEKIGDILERVTQLTWHRLGLPIWSKSCCPVHWSALMISGLPLQV